MLDWFVADFFINKMNFSFSQFEGGLSITAIIISGAYRLAEHVKKEPPVDAVSGKINVLNYVLQIVACIVSFLDN